MNSRTKASLLTASLFLAVLFAAFHFAAVASAEDVTVTEWTLMADDGNGQPGEEVDSFLPSDHKIHFQAAISGNIPAGAKAKWTFTAVDTDKAKDTKITDLEIPVEKAGATSLNASVSLPNDWPIGSYRLDLFVNGKQIGSLDYNVEKEEE